MNVIQKCKKALSRIICDNWRSRSFRTAVNLGLVGSCVSVFGLSPVYGGYDPFEDPDKEVYILSIDGGGMRGSIPATILQEMETRLGKGLRVAECFDLIAGTSTGGILALGLSLKDPETGRPKFSASELKAIYSAENGHRIFPQASRSIFSRAKNMFWEKYSDQGLRTLLGEYFGEFTLRDLVTEVHIPTYEQGAEEIFFFDSKKARDFEGDNFYLKDVAQATGSAPTFLPPVVVKDCLGNSTHTFVDGGMVCNDPSYVGLKRAQELYPKAKKFVVVSLGTGECSRHLLEAEMTARGQLQWAALVPNLMMRGASEMTHFLLKRELSPSQYLRIQAPLSAAETEMDRVDETLILQWQSTGRKAFKQNEEKIRAQFEALHKDPIRAFKRVGIFPQYKKRVEGASIDFTNTPMTSSELEALGRYFLDQTVEKIYAEGTQMGQLGSNVFRYFPDLKRLNLGSSRVSRIEIGTFRPLENLTLLHLESNPSLVIEKGALGVLRSLKVLYLSHNDWKFTPESLLLGLERLEELYLNDNLLEALPEGLFDNLSLLKRLTLHNNRLRSLDGRIFANNNLLVQLSLANNYLPGLKKEAFVLFETIKTLEIEPQKELPVEWDPGNVPDQFFLNSSFAVE